MGPSGVATAGLALDLGFAEPVNLYAEVSHLLADGEGLEFLLQWRGASSIKPCPRHWNIVPCNSNIVGFDDANQYRESSCTDPSQMHAFTCEDYKELARGLVAARAQHAAGTMTKAQLEAQLKASGFNCCENGFLYAFAQGRLHGISPSAAITIDFMHTFLQEGILNDEILLLLNANRMDLEVLKEFLQDRAWNWPWMTSSHDKQLWRIFSPKRSSRHRIKASASEMLASYSMVRYFVQVHVKPTTELQRLALRSFDQLAEIMDDLLDAKYDRVGGDFLAFAADLEVKATRFMEAHVEAYGVSFLKPKSHWLFDVVQQVRRDGRILDCFIVERLHLRAKQCVEHVRSLQYFEKSVLKGYLTRHSQRLKEDGLRQTDALVGELSAIDEFPGSEFAAKCIADNVMYRAHDLVMYPGGAADALAFVKDDDGDLCALVESLTFLSMESDRGSRWTRSRNVCILPVSSSVLYPSRTCFVTGHMFPNPSRQICTLGKTHFEASSRVEVRRR